MQLCSEKLENNGRMIEARLRRELRQSAPLVYEAEVLGTVRPTSIGRCLGELAGAIAPSSDELRLLYTLRFALPGDGETRVAVLSDGAHAMLGGILHSQVLGRAVPGAVRLLAGDTGRLRGALAGEPRTIARLARDETLIARIGKLVRDRYRLGDREIASRRVFSLVPFESGSLLTLSTLPRRTWRLAWTFDVGEFQRIARAVEGAL